MELLFRAKSIAEDVPEDLKEFEKGKDVYGFPVIEGEKAYMLKGTIDASDEFINIERWCAIDPETISQYTGWNDRTGKKIFRGDIVAQYNIEGELVMKGRVCSIKGCWSILDKKRNVRRLHDYSVNTKLENEKKCVNQ